MKGTLWKTIVFVVVFLVIFENVNRLFMDKYSNIKIFTVKGRILMFYFWEQVV